MRNQAKFCRIRRFIGGQNGRTHGAETVQALAQNPLAMALLQMPRGHVVDDGIAEYMRKRGGLGNATPARTDDNRQFAFVIQAAGWVQMAQDGFAHGDDGGMGFGKYNGEGWHHILGPAIKARPRKFLGVFMIILADAEHVLRWARNGGEDLRPRYDWRIGKRIPRGGQRCWPRRNEAKHIARQRRCYGGNIPQRARFIHGTNPHTGGIRESD